MSMPWNEFDLKKPPFQLECIPAAHARGVKPLKLYINQYLRGSKSTNADLAQAAALLSRLIARRSNSFRHIIGFRSMLKVNAALCRLLRIDLNRELNHFRTDLPDYELADGTYEVPNRAYFDYLLVRVVSVYHIHRRVRECCKDAAEYLAKMIRNNFFMDTLTLFLAVLAKLYRMNGILGNHCAELYNQLVGARQCFPYSRNLTFLQSDDVLPEKLENFIVEDQMSITADPVIQMSRELLNAPAMPKSSTSRQRVDTGIEVERPAPNQKSFDVEKELKTVDEVRRFIAKQNASRQKSLIHSLTKKISMNEWSGATRIFEKKLQFNNEQKALIMFRNFIKRNL